MPVALVITKFTLNEKAIGIFSSMKTTRRKISTRLKIVGATLTTIFSLFSVFTATYAWFATNASVTATGAQIKVKAPEIIQFDLYYLHHFAGSPNKNGNYNSDTGLFAGYETAAANPVFMQVNYDSSGNVTDLVDPTAIDHLWPAHKLTYAIVINSGTLNSFALSSWDEVTLPTVLTQVNSEDVEISLSWAINMYGGAYYVTSTASVTDDIATGFVDYNDDVDDGTLVDKFTYSQTNIAPAVKPSISILNSISGTAGENKRVVLYFSIEYSDDSSTYYKKNSNNNYYVKDTLGNSNCYENLSLTDLEFMLS